MVFMVTICQYHTQGRNFTRISFWEVPGPTMMARKWVKSEEKSDFSGILMIPGALFTPCPPINLKSYTYDHTPNKHWHRPRRHLVIQRPKRTYQQWPSTSSGMLRRRTQMPCGTVCLFRRYARFYCSCPAPTQQNGSMVDKSNQKLGEMQHRDSAGPTRAPQDESRIPEINQDPAGG